MRLLGRLRPIRWQAAGAYGAMIAATIVSLVVPLALRSIIDAAIGQDPDALDWLPFGAEGRGRLVSAALVLVGLGVFRAGLSFVQRYATAWVGRTVATDFRRDVFSQLLALDVAFHDKASVGQLMTRVTDDTEQVRAFAATALAEIVSIVMLLLGTALILSRIDPLLAGVALAPVPVLVFLAFFASGRLRPRFFDVQRATGGLTARLQESLAQIRVVQAFTAEQRTSAAYDADNEILFGKRMSVARVFTSVFPVMGLVLGLGTAAVLFLGGERVISGELSIGTLVAFDSYILLLGMPVRRLGFLLNLAARASTSATRVYELLDRTPSLAQRSDAVDLEGRGSASWRDVDFSFGDGPLVLDGVTINVQPGEHVVIVGRSGAGKTALAELLPRLYDPTRGTVEVDGRDVTTVRRNSLRAVVGYVEQEAFLFSATVHDNVAFARPDATRDQVVEASRLAGADGFVTALPEGYETMVGERGVTLSGGQRQRLALARALLLDPPVLVLDDAVSAVDAGTEARIREALATSRGSHTVVSIAQRLSTILAADRIVVLDHGQVVESGTHAELLQAGGVYQELFDTTVATATGTPARGAARTRPVVSAS